MKCPECGGELFEMKKGNHHGLSLIWLAILMGWLLDVLSSIVGISMKIQEGSAFFLVFSAVWLILFVGLSTFVYFLDGLQ